MTPTPSAGRRRSTREGARCRAAVAAPLVIVAGPVSPAWTGGGLRQKRPGAVVAGAVSPGWTRGGLRPKRPGPRPAGAVRPGPDRRREDHARPHLAVAPPRAPELRRRLDPPP